MPRKKNGRQLLETILKIVSGWTWRPQRRQTMDEDLFNIDYIYAIFLLNLKFTLQRYYIVQKWISILVKMF